MDYTPTNKSNFIAQKFWAHTKEIWSSLSIGGKQKWLKTAIEVTQTAWAVATMGTDLSCPVKYTDFAFTSLPYDVDGDGILETEIEYSSKRYYGKLDKKCKNTWDAVAVKQILLQLCNQYALRDAGIW